MVGLYNLGTVTHEFFQRRGGTDEPNAQENQLIVGRVQRDLWSR